MGSTGPLLMGVATAAGLVMIVIGLRSPRKETSIEERLAQLGTGERPPTLEEIELSLPFTERVIRPRMRKIADFITQLTPAQTLAGTRRKLLLAGMAHKISPAEFLAVRYVLMAVFGAGVIAFVATSTMATYRKIIVIPIVTALGFYLPVLWLISRIRQRSNEIRRALPDALDLLTICVEAGLGFDAAMVKVCEKWDNELSHAFARVLQEIQLGKLRREALRDMADTMDVSEVSNFVAAVCQAEQLGVSISKVLRIQSDQMRVRRRQRAEEEARKAPVKIMVPAVFLIFPALFIVILGPAALTMMDMFGR